MFSKTTIYEFKMLLRSGWIAILTVVLLLLIGFASFNGYKKVTKRTNSIEKAKEVVAKDDAKILDQISRIEKGENLGLSNWLSPTNPSAIGYRHPRLVSMDAQGLSYIATGQSDMFTHHMKPLIFGKLFALDYSEIRNPVQLLFGTFDVSFVFIFIIPLLIIAFTYNTLSKEKELGTLRLIGSQPVIVNKWLFQKMLLKFIVFAIISIGSFLLFAFIFGSNIADNLPSLLVIVILLKVYELFWFTVSYLINIKINDSSKNAIYLIGLWLVITLLIPALATQLSMSIYPKPSRLNMVNEIKEKELEMKEKQNEIMASFLQDHPELSENTDQSKFGFWHKYFASQDLLTDEIKPLLKSHEDALRNQQKVTGLFKYISPSLLVSDAMNKVAGTSTNDYEDYKLQVFDFATKWREHIQVLLFKDIKYTKNAHEKRPKYNFKPLKSSIWIDIVSLIFLSLIAIGIGKFVKNKTLF